MAQAAVAGHPQFWQDAYDRAAEPFPWGPDTTYERGFAFLRDCGTVQDWGCGTGYGRKFAAGRYTGVDGCGPFADVIADLRHYRSPSDGIFIRHVLEHNHEWPLILANAVASAGQRLVLILFTPLGDETKVIGRTGEIPDISFRREDLTAFLSAFDVSEEHVVTDTQYGGEHIFCAARKP